MALINPVYGLVFPFLCIFTIPMAIFAGITTTLAFSVLMFRVAVVYLDIALGLIPQYFSGRSRSQALPTTGHHQHRAPRDGLKTPISPTSSVSSGSEHTTPTLFSHLPSSGGYLASSHRSPHRRKSSYGFGAALRHSRHSSQASLASLGTITPIHEDEVDMAPAVAEAGLTPSVGLDRDFEGVGGWRIDDREDEDDDANWANINSRFSLPVERATTRHHQRSQSVGPITPSEGAWLMSKTPSARPDRSPERTRSGSRSPGKSLLVSPGSSRKLNQHVQLPLSTLGRDYGYFPELVSPRTLRKPSHTP